VIFSFDKASKSSEIGKGKIAGYENNNHALHLVDSDGNAVSATTTLNDNYGSKIYDELGFFSKQSNGRLSAKPGVPNLMGYRNRSQ
jgi:gamma-glutamyltranspeptidase/glutathione hydrolase